MLEFSLAKDTLSVAYPFLNCFEVLPKGVSSESRLLISKYMSVYPNPFNASTNIRYNLLEQGKVNIRIYNVNGRLIRTLFTGSQLIGNYTLAWNGRDQQNKTAAMGVYYLRMELPDRVCERKLLLF
jgi:hypothetical protein